MQMTGPATIVCARGDWEPRGGGWGALIGGGTQNRKQN